MRSFIALGGNLGTVEETFRFALDELNAVPQVRVRRSSACYRSLPMGEEAGEPYLNAAAELEAECTPLELLDILQTLETRHGRKRKKHWGPRTLDLDLLLFGEEVLSHPRLLLPHPGCWYRRFVLDPLTEIAPEVQHPLKRSTIRELRERLLQKPLSIGIAGGTLTDRQKLAEELSADFANLRAELWSPERVDQPKLLFWLGTPTDQKLAFEDLPLLPRLDLTEFPEDPFTAAKNAVTAALPRE